MFTITVVIEDLERKGFGYKFKRTQYIHENLNLRQAIKDVNHNLEKDVKEWAEIHYPNEKNFK